VQPAPIISWERILPLYYDLIELYTKRNLGFKEDILHAFSGILSVFEKATRSKFIHGMPTVVLPHSLFWVWKGRHAIRRKNEAGIPYYGTRLGVGRDGWVLSNTLLACEMWMTRVVSQ